MATAMDMCKVDASTFDTLCFMGAQERVEWNEDKNAPKVQKHTQEGVPIWRVQLAGTNWRGRAEMLTITVPSQENPNNDFSRGEIVEASGLMFGVSPKRNGGFTTWLAAESLHRAGVAIRAAS